MLDDIRASQGINRVGYARLVGDDLLGAQRHAHGLLGGQPERLVHAVGVQGLGAAHHCCQGLQGDAHHVVLGLLGGEGRAAGLRMEAQHGGSWLLGAEALAHQPGPQAAGGAELGNFFQKTVVRVEEEGNLPGKIIHVQPDGDGGLDVGDGVDHGKGQLLHGGGAGLADVVARDADGVPVRHLLLAEAEHVGDQAHGGGGREDIGAAGHVFLQDVVLDGAAQLAGLNPLAPGNGNIHGQQDGGGGVDGHAGGDLVQRDVVEQGLHIFDRGDGHAHFANLAASDGIVGVVADLGGQVEGHREAGLALLEQEAVALVGFFGAGVAGVLAHGPEAAAVHAGLDAARVGVFAGEAQLLQVIGVGVSRDEGRRQGDAGGGLEGQLALRAFGAGLAHMLQPAMVFSVEGHGLSLVECRCVMCDEKIEKTTETQSTLRKPF